MKYLLTVLFLLVDLVTIAQQLHVKTIKETNSKFKKQHNTFPVIEIIGDKKATAVINTYLQKDFLDIEDPKAIKKSIFENVNPGNINDHATLSDISFEVLCNKSRLLSLAISATGCGAYCEDFTEYYTFDTRNGNIITPDTLIRPEFKHILIDSVNSHKRDLLREKIAWVNDTLKMHLKLKWNTADDSDYYTEMKQLYTECLDSKYEDISFHRWYLNKEMLYVELDRCSAHVNRNVDELGDFKFYFSLKVWSKYFTDYGLKLIR